MTLLAVALTLCGAAVHASWNLIIVRRPDPQAATAVALVAGAVLWAPVALATWRIDAEAWPYVAVSSVIELVYLATLAYAFEHATFGVIYPVGRGLAPVLVLVGAALLGQRPAPLEIGGVLLVTLGVLGVRGFGEAAAKRRDLGLGVAIAMTIAAYTLVDKEGLRHASAFAYLWLILALPAVAYAAIRLRLSGPAALRRELRLSTAVAGLGMYASYAFVLLALGLADAAPVAAIRESSVVMAAIGAAILGIEPLRPLRIVGSGLVAAGVGLLALSA